MKKVFLLLIILFPLVLNAQKLVKNEIDKFDNDKVLRTSHETIFGGSIKKSYKVWFRVSGRGSENLKRVGLNFDISLETSVYKGNKITFLFENGENVQIEANDSYLLDHFYVSSLGTSIKIFGVSPSYYLDANSPILQTILDNNITDIRVEFRDSYTDFPVSKKNNEKIKKSIRLVIDELNKN